MKYAAIFMAVLVALTLALGIYTLANAHLVVVSVTEDVAAAFERPEEFAALQTAMDHEALLGTPYADELPGSSMDYNFRTYTIRLRNPGLIAAEMVEIQPTPVNGDILSYTTLDAAQVNANRTVPARGEANLWTVVLSSAQDTAPAQRTFRITYYLWGMKKTTTATYKPTSY